MARNDAPAEQQPEGTAADVQPAAAPPADPYKVDLPDGGSITYTPPADPHPADAAPSPAEHDAAS
jgi:hypothetical protein